MTQIVSTPQDETPRVAVGIARVSSDAQDSARQVSSVRRLHAEHYSSMPLREHFRAEGSSATKQTIFEREPELIDALERGEVGVILCDEQTRLVRGTGSGEWAAFYDLVTRSGATIHTNLEGIVSDDESSELVSMIRAWDSRREIRKLKHRTADGKRSRAEKGLWPWGAVPAGYKRDSATGALTNTPDWQTIPGAFQMYADGDSLVSVLAFVREGLGRPDYDRRTLRKSILSNGAYLGLVPLSGELLPGQHDALVEPELFERVQLRLERESATRTREPHAWPFSGIARCGECRRNLRFHEVTKANGSTYTYARCQHTGCSRRTIPAAAFESNLIVQLAAIADLISILLLTSPHYAVPTVEGPSAEDARAALAETQAEVRRLGKLVAQRALDADAAVYVDALRARDDAEAMLDGALATGRNYRDELADLSGRIMALGDLAPANTSKTMQGKNPDVARIAEGWLRADFAQQRDVIAKTIEAVYLTETGYEWHFRKGLIEPVRASHVFTTQRDDGLIGLETDGWGKVCNSAPHTCTSPW